MNVSAESLPHHRHEFGDHFHDGMPAALQDNKVCSSVAPPPFSSSSSPLPSSSSSSSSSPSPTANFLTCSVKAKTKEDASGEEAEVTSCTVAYSRFLKNPFDARSNNTGTICLSYAESDSATTNPFWRDRGCDEVTELHYGYAAGSPSLKTHFLDTLRHLAQDDNKTNRSSVGPALQALATMAAPSSLSSGDEEEKWKQWNADGLVFTNGGLAAIHLVLQTLLARHHQKLQGQSHGQEATAPLRLVIPAPCHKAYVELVAPLVSPLLQLQFMERPVFLLWLQDQRKLQHNHSSSNDVVLLTQPNNPDGYAWSNEEMTTICEWMELCHGTLIFNNALLWTAFAAADNVDPNDTVVPIVPLPTAHRRLFYVNSFSKVGLSGLHLGFAYTYDEEAAALMHSLCKWNPVSNLTQSRLLQLLRHFDQHSHQPLAQQQSRDMLFPDQSRRLYHLYLATTQLLQRHRVPFQAINISGSGGGGCTIMLDLRLVTRTFADELKLWQQLQFSNTSGGVLLSRGEEFHCSVPGWFRFCFTFDWTAVATACARLGRFVALNAAGSARAVWRQHYINVLRETWAATDKLFALLANDDVYLMRPIALRHPLIFYLAHCPSFALSQLNEVHIRSNKTLQVHAVYDELFVRGIDPDVDTGDCHAHSCDIERSKWPSLTELRQYRDDVRALHEQLIMGDGVLSDDDLQRVVPTLDLIIEHELMHQETLVYMLMRLPTHCLKRPSVAARLTSSSIPLLRHLTPSTSSDPNASSNSATAALSTRLSRSSSSFVRIPGGRTSIGALPVNNEVNNDDDLINTPNPPMFRWDNEYPRHQVSVAEFSVSATPVTNGEFVEFVLAGGYERSEFWMQDDWAWLQKEGFKMPPLWTTEEEEEEQTVTDKVSSVSSSASSSSSAASAARPLRASSFRIRGLFGSYSIEQAWDHPVWVSHAEASAYARWIGFGVRLPTEAEWLRVAHSSSAWTHTHQSGNLDMQRLLHNVPTTSVYAFPPAAPEVRRAAEGGGEAAAADDEGVASTGVFDLVGNGWEWTSSPFMGHPGFTAMPTYPGYSADFFDGKHYVMLGASPYTPARLVRDTFRNWFHRHYRYCFAKFRLVRDQHSALIDQVVQGLSVSLNNTATLTLPSQHHQPPQQHHQHQVNLKRIPSSYFYDDEGSAIYQEITTLSEYYLTRAELSILSSKRVATALCDLMQPMPRHLVELGSGDGHKLKPLIHNLLDLQGQRQVERNDYHLTYHAIDISSQAVQYVRDTFRETERQHSNFQLHAVTGDNLAELAGIANAAATSASTSPILVCFIGSSLGNLSLSSSQEFLCSLRSSLRRGDYLLLGVDLVKSPSVLVPAYSDSKGVTARFNLNLLSRLNRDTGARPPLDPTQFRHYATFNPHTNAMESYLYCCANQTTTLNNGVKLSFKQNELIHTEISQKYTVDDVKSMAAQASFEVVNLFFDDNHYFVDALWKCV